ncbi:MAG TPA: hypothetical protein VGF06_10150 [Terriglobales bacterium]
MRRNSRLIDFIICLAAAGIMRAQKATEPSGPPPEVYTGKILALSGPLAGHPTDLAVVIGRTSTAKELEQFESLQHEYEGQTKLADALTDAYDVGAYRLGTDLALAIKMVTVEKSEKGREYFLAGVRIPQGLEMQGKLSPRDYRFVVIKLKVDEKGKGEGQYLSSAKIRFKQNHQPEVEDYQTQPASITMVQMVKR